MAGNGAPAGCQRYGLCRRVVNASLAGLALIGLAAAGGHAAEPAILVLGDSLTAGFGLEPKDAFPAQLERMVRARGRAVRVVAAGVSGDTTAGGKTRLDWAIAGVAGGPAAAIVALGGNDGLRGIAPATTEANLDAILARLKEKGIVTLLAGMRAPPNLGADYVAAFDPLFGRVARRHGALLYPFILEGVAAQPALNQPDGIHPNAAGAAEMARRLIPAVEELLARAGG